MIFVKQEIGFSLLKGGVDVWDKSTSQLIDSANVSRNLGSYLRKMRRMR